MRGIRLGYTVAWVLVIATLAASRCFSADAESEARAWIPWRNETATASPTHKVWDQQLRAIAVRIRADGVFADIRGYYPHLFGKVEAARGGNPWIGFLAFEAWWPKAVERTPDGTARIKPKWEYNRPEGLWIGVNTLRDLDHWRWWEDERGRFYELPETKREIAGFPVVGDRMFITRDGKASLFEPLPQERALRWVIGQLQRQVKADEGSLDSARRRYEQFISPEGVARRKKEIETAAASQKRPENQALERRNAETRDQRREQDLRDAAMPKPGSREAGTAGLLRAYEERHAALSAAERTLPAWVKREPTPRGSQGEIVPPNTPGARPLIVVSRTFFDNSLPPTAMQLVTVPVEPFASRAKSDGKDPQKLAPLAVVEQTDWREVQKMLK